MHVTTLQRARVRVRGAVQGVGFRPFVYRLAALHGVSGWVANDNAGVLVEAEADEDSLQRFLHALCTDAPPRAVVQDVATELIDATGSTGFRIVASDDAGVRSTVVLPDIAPCAECMAEIRDPRDRRAGYAFTNCTNCGPRFSIVRALPYDRPHTTMAAFIMCDACAAEYHDPLDRRFHAQPNACPACGPHLSLVLPDGAIVLARDVIATAVAALKRGDIVAVKGVGGFHLMCDAASTTAVTRLRARKQRQSKPFALMAATVEQARRFVLVSADAEALLESPEAPIVLLPRLPARIAFIASEPLPVCDAVAPGHPELGVMLPPSPLHHLIATAFGAPLVATSGNLSEEPIAIDDADALERLHGIADLFLVHDRPIERHVDDSVARISDGAPRLLRRARGYAPMPIMLGHDVPPILAVGAQLKNAVALSRERQVFMSQHIGDLETHEAQLAFDRVVADFMRLYRTVPAAIAHDSHPDYASTHAAGALAARLGVRQLSVQHHHAHLAACMAEHHVTDTTLGIIWDGTGYGADGTIWGGEFLLGDAAGFDRIAHLRPFRLPGGDAAVRDPRRVALALLHDALGADAAAGLMQGTVNGFAAPELRTLSHMVRTGFNAPLTSSAGRLFDGIAALLGLCSRATYEGEAAIALEHAADERECGAYDMPALAGVLDWRPMVATVVGDMRRHVPVATIAARVHNAMVHAMTVQAEVTGCDRVALSGGCFQNRILAGRAAAALRRRGFMVLQHAQVPPNDGGIALGQVVVAASRLHSGY